MSAMATQITGVSIVCATVGSGGVQSKHQSFASLAFVRGIHRWPVNSPHKRPVTRKMGPFDDVIIYYLDIFYQGLTPTATPSGTFTLARKGCMLITCQIQACRPEVLLRKPIHTGNISLHRIQSNMGWYLPLNSAAHEPTRLLPFKRKQKL